MLSRLAVSEPIALELRQTSGSIYLHAQIFTGFMYTGAALCMWFLRAWKIGQLEEMAAQTHKAAESLDPVTEQPLGLSHPESKSNFLRRMCMWRRV